MGTNQNAVQRAVVLGITMVSAGLNGAFDALVCMAVHFIFLLCFGFWDSIAPKDKIMQEKHGNLAFLSDSW